MVEKERYTHKDFYGKALKFGDVIIYASPYGRMIVGEITRIRVDKPLITVMGTNDPNYVKYCTSSKDVIKADKKTKDRYRLIGKLKSETKRQEDDNELDDLFSDL